MAQRSTIHRINLEIADTDRQVYESVQMSIARADSETPQRMVARLLAFCLYWDPDLTFTGGVGAGDEPDLWIREPDGRVKTWIEVGLPDPKRLVKAARHCERVILLAYGRRIPEWQRDHLPALKEAKVEMAVLEHSFQERLVAGLDRTVNWQLTISGGTVYLTDGRIQHEGTITTF